MLLNRLWCPSNAHWRHENPIQTLAICRLTTIFTLQFGTLSSQKQRIRHEWRPPVRFIHWLIFDAYSRSPYPKPNTVIAYSQGTSLQSISSAASHLRPGRRVPATDRAIEQWPKDCGVEGTTPLLLAPIMPKIWSSKARIFSLLAVI